MTNALGTDISLYQNAISTPQYINFDTMKKNGASFVIIRASQATYVDRDMVWNWANAKVAGILRGAYHFLTWDIDPNKQADFFCDLVKYDPPELGLFADFEWWSTVPNNAMAILDAFCTRVESRIGKCGVYTAPGFWQPNGNQDPKWIKRPLWQAQWGVSAPTVMKPWKDWTFWQYTSKGDGLAYGCESLSVDMDHFNGSEAALLKYANVTPTAPPVVPSTDKAALLNMANDLTTITSKITDIASHL